MTKIAFIGAGSTVFVQKLLTDILLADIPGTLDIRLMDIDAERLATSELVAQKLAASADRAASIIATEDRSKALDGADFVIVLIQVGGYRPATVIDFEVPEAIGLRQTIGDTLGPGGILRGYRTARVLVDIANDMRRLCPDALMLQYVNPMAINCWALSRIAPDIKVIGLCHSVQKTSQMLADHLGEKIGDIRYLCAGINHMAFFTRFEKRTPEGYVDLYPRLREVSPPTDERVRYEVLKRFGYFVTESSEHFSEYVPWFIKRGRDDLLAEFAIPLNEYPRRCEAQISAWSGLREALLAAHQLPVERSEEYAASIIEAHVTGRPSVVYGNVPNCDNITNLPNGCSVEVPCLVDANGIQPTQIGALPPHLAALMLTNIAAQTCAVEAIMDDNLDQLRRALALDPHTSAELSLAEIWELANDMIAHHDMHGY